MFTSQILIDRHKRYIADSENDGLDLTRTTDNLQDALLIADEERIYIDAFHYDTAMYDKFSDLHLLIEKHDLKRVSVAVIKGLIIRADKLKGIKLYLSDGSNYYIRREDNNLLEVIEKITSDKEQFITNKEDVIYTQHITRMTTNYIWSVL